MPYADHESPTKALGGKGVACRKSWCGCHQS